MINIINMFQLFDVHYIDYRYSIHGHYTTKTIKKYYIPARYNIGNWISISIDIYTAYVIKYKLTYKIIAHVTIINYLLEV